MCFEERNFLVSCFLFIYFLLLHVGLIDGSSDTDEDDNDDGYEDESKPSGTKGKKGSKTKKKRKSKNLVPKAGKGKLRQSAESARLAEKKAIEEEFMNFEVREGTRRDRSQQTFFVRKMKNVE